MKGGTISRFIQRTLTARVAVLLCVASSLIAQSSWSQAGSVPRTSTDKWADSVIDVVTDPKLYQYTMRSLPLRLRRLAAMHVVPSSLGDEGVQGEDPALGILSVFASFINDGFERIDFGMPLADAKGRQLLPVLRRKLQKRLRPPVWSEAYEYEDEVDGKSVVWWHAETETFVRLSINPANIDRSGVKPSIWVSAGTERSNEED